MRRALIACVLAACAASPDAIDVELSPTVISSLDGTVHVSAIVSGGQTPLADEIVHVEITYTDRTGAPHTIAPVDGKTDDRGVFEATLAGFTFDGVGTITVSTSATVTATASFSVLDRSPPKVTILPPTSDGKVGPGLPLTIQVHATDEIGISEVALDLGDLQGALRSVAATGSPDTTLTFRTQVPQNATGTITLHALARDLSGNLAAADAITLVVDPAITIATPPGLSGTLLVDGTATQLAAPRAIAYSAKDDHLYIADQAGTGVCSPSCIWRVAPATGAIDPTPIVVGKGTIEGIAFDATADTLVYSDRSNILGRLTYSGTAYVAATGCDDPTKQAPQDPYHLVVDAVLGILAVDDQDQEVFRIATCAPTSIGVHFTTNSNFNQPRGIAAGAAGEFYVSDTGADRIHKVTSAGATSVFDATINAPYGMRWLAGGTTAFANTLVVAAQGDRMVASTTGAGVSGVAFLRNAPIDLTFGPGAMYVVTQNGNGTRGRLYRVTGF